MQIYFETWVSYWSYSSLLCHPQWFGLIQCSWDQSDHHPPTFILYTTFYIHLLFLNRFISYKGKTGKNKMFINQSGIFSSKLRNPVCKTVEGVRQCGEEEAVRRRRGVKAARGRLQLLRCCYGGCCYGAGRVAVLGLVLRYVCLPVSGQKVALGSPGVSFLTRGSWGWYGELNPKVCLTPPPTRPIPWPLNTLILLFLFVKTKVIGNPCC